MLTERFTDFLVNEISLAGEILHLREIGKPKETEQNAPAPAPSAETTEDTEAAADLPAELQFEPHADWTAATTVALRPHLSNDTIKALHALLLDGKTPRRAQDSGWGSRQVAQQQKVTEEEMAMNQDAAPVDNTPAPSQGRQRGRGRGGHRGGGRDFVADTREVVSQVSSIASSTC